MVKWLLEKVLWKVSRKVERVRVKLRSLPSIVNLQKKRALVYLDRNQLNLHNKSRSKDEILANC